MIVWFVASWHTADQASTSRKGSSTTQPGHGIRKIIDLYHDLPNLVEKANKHLSNIPQSEREEMDNLEFTGLSKEAIEDELQEYVVCLWLIWVHATYMWHVTPWNTSCRHCHTALKLLNMLVPNFESRADMTDNLEFFCAPVCVLFYISSCHCQATVSRRFQFGFCILMPVQLVPLRTYRLKRLSWSITWYVRWFRSRARSCDGMGGFRSHDRSGDLVTW